MANNVVEILIRARDQASRQLQQVNASLDKTVVALGALSAAAVGAGTVVFNFTRQVAQRADEFNKLSQQTGLSVEQLTRLTFAADQSKTTFEGISRGITILSRNMFDLSQGIGEARDAFEELGVSVTDENGSLRSTDEVLLDVADRFSEMEDGALKTGAAMKIFGRSGAELIPLLNQGRAGIEEMAQASDDLNITIDRLTTQLSETFADRLGQVDLQIEGFKARIATALLPTMIELVEAVSEVLVRVADWVEENQALIRNTAELGARFGALTVVAFGVAAAIRAVTFSLGFLGASALATARGPLLILGAAIAAVTIRHEKLKAELEEPIQVRFGSLSDLESIDQEIGRIAAEIQNLREEQARLLEGQTTVEIQGRVVPLDPNVRSEFERVQGAIEEAAQSIEFLGDQRQVIQRLSRDVADVGGSAEAAASGVELLRTGLIDLLGVAAGGRGLEALEVLFPDLDEVEDRARQLREIGEFFEAGGIVGPEVPLDLQPQLESLEGFREELERAGIDADAFFDKLREIGFEGDEVFVGITAGIEIFAARANDSFALASEAARTTFEALDQFAGDLSTTLVRGFGDALTSGEDFAVTMENLTRGLIGVVADLVVSLVALAVKLKIVKAIAGSISFGPFGFVTSFFGAFFSEGGQVPELSRGGQIAPARLDSLRPARLAEGGQIGSLSHLIPLRAQDVARGQGGFTVPGTLRGIDSVPALLAPREIVLPTINGLDPGEVVSNLARFDERLERGSLGSAVRRGPAVTQQAQTIFQVNTVDVDSFREQVRSGNLNRELERAAELGRL